MLVTALVPTALLSGCNTPGAEPDLAPGCQPTAEQCNGRDDDCDGTVDEAETGEPLTRACSNSCGLGTEVCVNGSYVHCTAPEPTAEICDGLDNDCDGQVDEGFECAAGTQRPCGSSIGACRLGMQICDEKCTWGACQGGVEPQAETCDGVQDEDCDGTVDEGCACTSGQDRACCGGTVIACSNGSWPSCPAVPAEICDGLDNDCNGLADDHLPAIPYLGEEHASGIDSCATGTIIAAPIVEQGGPTKLGPYYLYKPDLSPDRDFFQIHTEEIDDLSCIFTPEYNECYTLELALDEPAGADYEFCVHYVGSVLDGPYSDCTDALATYCSTDHRLDLSWAGGCGRNDDLVFYVEVFAPSGRYETCRSYSLNVELLGSGPQKQQCD